MENSTATDHPAGTCVPAAGEGVVCAPAAEAEGAASNDNQTASEDGNDAQGTNNENGN
jgi:hypothetical protein